MPTGRTDPGRLCLPRSLAANRTLPGVLQAVQGMDEAPPVPLCKAFAVALTHLSVCLLQVHNTWQMKDRLVVESRG